jgi:hypothetical protein
VPLARMLIVAAHKENDARKKAAKQGKSTNVNALCLFYNSLRNIDVNSVYPHSFLDDVKEHRIHQSLYDLKDHLDGKKPKNKTVLYHALAYAIPIGDERIGELIEESVKECSNTKQLKKTLVDKLLSR